MDDRLRLRRQYDYRSVQHDNNKLVLALAANSTLVVVLGLLGLWQWFGLALWPLIFLCAAVGHGPNASRGPIRTALCVMVGVNLLIFAAMLFTDRTDGDPVLILGTPVSTAFLIYGIWPMGNLIGVLYFVMFERSVLPPVKLERFLADFGRRDPLEPNRADSDRAD